MGEDMAARTSHDTMEMPAMSLDCEVGIDAGVDEAVLDVSDVFFLSDLTILVFPDSLDGIVKPNFQVFMSSAKDDSLLMSR